MTRIKSEDSPAQYTRSRAHCFVYRDGVRVCSECGLMREVTDKNGIQFFKQTSSGRKLVDELPKCKKESIK